MAIVGQRRDVIAETLGRVSLFLLKVQGEQATRYSGTYVSEYLIVCTSLTLGFGFRPLDQKFCEPQLPLLV